MAWDEIIKSVNSLIPGSEGFKPLNEMISEARSSIESLLNTINGKTATETNLNSAKTMIQNTYDLVNNRTNNVANSLKNTAQLWHSQKSVSSNYTFESMAHFDNIELYGIGVIHYAYKLTADKAAVKIITPLDTTTFDIPITSCSSGWCRRTMNIIPSIHANVGEYNYDNAFYTLNEVSSGMSLGSIPLKSLDLQIYGRYLSSEYKSYFDVWVLYKNL